MRGSDHKISLETFCLSNMAECGRALRQIGEQVHNMDEFAESTVRYFYDTLVTANGEKACALVRFFSTQPAELLPARLRGMLPEDLPAAVRCLTLLATVGEEPEWCDRMQSKGHQAIPLIDVEKVKKLPMIYQMIQQLGLDLSNVLKPDESILIDQNEKNHNVFYVAAAKGNPVLPYQSEFVEPYGIKSVLGIGGVLPTGEMFAVVLFGKVFIRRSVADLFRTLAINLKVALLPFGTR